MEDVQSQEMPLGAGPPNEEPLERFDDATLTWSPVPAKPSPGLHKFELHGRTVFRLLEDELDWRIADRATGQMHVLRDRDDVLWWHRPPSDPKKPRALSMPLGISLPMLAERAAVSASGMLPQRIGDRLVYLNVDRDIAVTIADALGLVVRVTHDEIDLEV